MEAHGPVQERGLVCVCKAQGFQRDVTVLWSFYSLLEPAPFETKEGVIAMD